MFGKKSQGVALAPDAGMNSPRWNLWRKLAGTDTQWEKLQQMQAQIERIEARNAELEAQRQELQAANARLESLATTDGLTGLKNHRVFQEQLEAEFIRSARYGTPLALILVDVDQFKQYNDACGHPEGDVALKRVADLLRANVRGIDLIARYGGEEFALILPNTLPREAVQTAERLRAAIEAAEWPLRPVTCSFGVASQFPAMQDRAQLIREADEALYASKQAGRNCVTHYSMRAQAIAYLALTTLCSMSTRAISA